jgi:hypothetical protein
MSAVEFRPAAEDLSDEGAVLSSGSPIPKTYEAFYERNTPGEAFTEEDLASPAFRKILMDQLRRLASENHELKRYREEFHDRDKQVKVLEAQTAPVAELVLLSNIALAVGGLVAGVGVSLLLAKTFDVGIAVLVLGSILMFAPLVARKLK